MTESKLTTPEGMHTITPHIVVNDAAAATDWYKQVLGAEERSRIEVPGGKLMQVELWFGDSVVMLADEFPDLGVLSPLSVGGTATVLHLYTNDVDAVWKGAVDAGAEVRQPLQNVFWGERYGQITDPFGHRWGLAQPSASPPEAFCMTVRLRTRPALDSRARARHRRSTASRRARVQPARENPPRSGFSLCVRRWLA